MLKTALRASANGRSGPFAKAWGSARRAARRGTDARGRPKKPAKTKISFVRPAAGQSLRQCGAEYPPSVPSLKGNELPPLIRSGSPCLLPPPTPRATAATGPDMLLEAAPRTLSAERPTEFLLAFDSAPDRCPCAKSPGRMASLSGTPSATSSWIGTCPLSSWPIADVLDLLASDHAPRRGHGARLITLLSDLSRRVDMLEAAEPWLGQTGHDGGDGDQKRHVPRAA